mmetsp:Transcript_27595/g.83080  ORF Transcript_27595/g.83080 Transcript_27595/m.83080 type:complete len:145 (-) Transcript_27595:1246-1680(-)
MADPKTRRYAVKKWSIDRYHKRTHRSRDLIENDILAGLLKLEPGDTRYMTPCVLCWLNKDHLRARHFNLDWHHNELVYGPAEGWHLDVYYLTVKSKLDGYAYIFIFVDIDSGFIIHQRAGSDWSAGQSRRVHARGSQTLCLCFQ